MAGANEPAVGPARSSVKRIVETTTTTTRHTRASASAEEPDVGVARVEQLGRRAGEGGERTRGVGARRNEGYRGRTEPEVEGNPLATTISTIAAQSGQSRIVVALLRDGQELQLKIQEMRPGVFEVGASLAECAKYLEEHQRLLRNLSKQKEGPVEAWLAKYKKLAAVQPEATAELRLVYMCMAENLQGCWRALLGQLELRLQLLDETCKFFGGAERLAGAIEQADAHVATYRREFLEGPGSARFEQAASELRRLNESVLAEHGAARRQQRQLVELIGRMAASNLGDSRSSLLVADAQSLTDFVNKFIEPLERRKLQLESVLTTTTTTTSSNNNNNNNTSGKSSFVTVDEQTTRATSQARPGESGARTRRASGEAPGGLVRSISNFNDLSLAENWLNLKVEQLNSSLLSSLGASAPDTRSILNKHEQIALECSAIEEATLNFSGKNIHAIKSAADAPKATRASAELFGQQKQLAERARDVITILDARLVLLRRTIEFYARAREATTDINRMMRRLQVDNSLQSVQFVADELELKDVSSVVASGATIISELQQLQLAQQHGQRSRLVSLNLVTGGIRAIIDQLNQDLAHLKTVLGQRRLVLLNEDATKMAQNFTSKCHQLKFWLESHVKSHLLANGRLGFDAAALRAYCDSHEELRRALQQKTLEVEALLRLLSTLTESFDAVESQTADEIQRDTDELRADWIAVTNCLDARLEFARKYLLILNGLAELASDIELLGAGGRARTSDERTDADIESAIEQALAQLANQVKNFTLDAQKADTALLHAAALEAKPTRHDINKQQIVGHANGALKLLSERNKTNISRLLARGPRKWHDETAPLAASTTKTRSTSESGSAHEPASERQTSADETTSAPRFARPLADAALEPFSSTTLECELEPASGQCQVEWLLNNKRIPGNIKHSVASEANRHALTIHQFGPTCCGTYTARAINPLGQAAASSCRLRLSGIREDEGDPRESSSESQQHQPQPLQTRLSEAQTGRAPTRWTQNGANGWQQQQQQQHRQVSKERALERIIQGVESPSARQQPTSAASTNTNTNTNTTISRQVVRETENQVARFPVTRASYDGEPRVDFIDSPAPRSSSSARTSRSISRSPFEGTPQPPVFMQGLRAEQLPAGAGGCSQAGLVCVVIGNPPPSVEWLHNEQPIASAKCARPATSARASICKLTIETLNDKTRGQYVCRASNKLGQSSTALTLTR